MVKAFPDVLDCCIILAVVFRLDKDLLVRSYLVPSQLAIGCSNDLHRLILVIVAGLESRFKYALSAIIGLAGMIAASIASSHATSTFDDAVFWLNRATYDRVVAQERSHQALGMPVQMIVDMRTADRVLMAPQFFYTVYDETDEVAIHPSFVLEHSGNPSPYKLYVRHISGHYYQVVEA